MLGSPTLPLRRKSPCSSEMYSSLRGRRGCVVEVPVGKDLAPCACPFDEAVLTDHRHDIGTAAEVDVAVLLGLDRHASASDNTIPRVGRTVRVWSRVHTHV